MVDLFAGMTAVKTIVEYPLVPTDTTMKAIITDAVVMPVTTFNKFASIRITTMCQEEGTWFEYECKHNLKLNDEGDEAAAKRAGRARGWIAKYDEISGSKLTRAIQSGEILMDDATLATLVGTELMVTYNLWEMEANVNELVNGVYVDKLDADGIAMTEIRKGNNVSAVSACDDAAIIQKAKGEPQVTAPAPAEKPVAMPKPTPAAQAVIEDDDVPF